MGEFTEAQLRESLTESEIPDYLWDGLVAHIINGREVGGFLTAVLMNDLANACFRADVENKVKLCLIVTWIYNHAPSASWGSLDAVKEWQEKGGQEGIERQRG